MAYRLVSLNSKGTWGWSHHGKSGKGFASEEEAAEDLMLRIVVGCCGLCVFCPCQAKRGRSISCPATHGKVGVFTCFMSFLLLVSF